MRGHTNITGLLLRSIISLVSFELCTTREDKNVIRKQVHGNTCMEITFYSSCCFVCRLHETQQSLWQTTSDKRLCVISLAQALACQHTNTDTAVNTKIFKCYSA